MRREKVLIIKLSAIGDVVMATPAFAAIRRKHPSAHISILIGEWAKPVVENNPNIDEIISVDENIFWKRKVIGLIGLFSKLHKQHFKVIYIMHWSNLFNLFAFLLGAEERIGFDRFGKSKFLTRKVPFSEGVKGIHTVERYLMLVEEKLNGLNKEMEIYLTEDEISRGEKILEEYNINKSGKIIGIAPGGGENPKSRMFIRRWPREYFISLGRKIISELGVPILLFGNVLERSLCDDIENRIDKKSMVINLAGKTTLREVAAIMKKCSLVITNDSGLLHLAAAAGTNTISLFGPTAPWDKVPISLRNTHFFFYKNYSCSPCYKYGKFPHCKEISCLRSIHPEEVFCKIAELLRE
jgi:lipopolysaccharide heptosyltransferase II